VLLKKFRTTEVHRGLGGAERGRGYRLLTGGVLGEGNHAAEQYWLGEASVQI
jgi:hypothetical protein